MGMRLRRVMTCMGGETWVQEDGRDEWCMGTKVVENSISMHGHAWPCKGGGNEREGHMRETRWCDVERGMGFSGMMKWVYA